ncbi:MAG: heme ABC exporter ATP-binding protein CcmA [Candidatus Rokubacteria bacterium]|nr:heme ABC exporter ATP-binding protein CcmA [Candidatus Rokubacteria bacterium]
MTADPLVRVEALEKAFGPVAVLDRVELAVARGQGLALLGPNGAGKTTLLKILATLIRPTRGRAIVAGHDTVDDAEGVRRAVGLMAHGAYVYEDLTAFENLEFWLGLAGRDVSADRVRSALANVELDAVADERVRAFSAGMRRRLGLARLALLEPRVLLLDEPFAGLDARARKWLNEHLAAFKERGGAILMTTHSFSRDLTAADRVAILAGGTSDPASPGRSERGGVWGATSGPPR